jgi:hypothetical protein
MERIEKTVFISYRRRDESWALAVFQHLTQHGYDVFIDYDGIASGNFETAIFENIRARAHFLVVLTPSALDRTSDPKDWMRREIEAALDSQRNIVPLMLAGFQFGAGSHLTGKLAKLQKQNGLRIYEGYFAEAMDRLRTRYLNAPFGAVLHPASDPAQQVAKEQKDKATAAALRIPSMAPDPTAGVPRPALVQPLAHVDLQSVIGDATSERPPELADALKAAKAVQDSGLMAIPELIEPMETACPRLATILRSAAVRTSLETYERQDAESIRLQVLLKQEAFWSNLCLLAAGVISGFILAVSAGVLGSLSPTLADETVTSRVILLLGLLTLALGAYSAYFGYMARDQGRIARWQTCRGEAEAARLNVFSTVASGAAAAGKDVALFGFAVVVTHLLEDQRTWLGARAKRHRESAEKTIRMGVVASVLALIGGCGAIIASQTSGSPAVWIVLAGIVGSVIGSFATNREAVNRDGANAERYDKARKALDAFAARVDGVAAKIAAGQPEALNAFTKTIADLLSAENKQWLDGTAQANAAIDKLDEQLSQLGKPKGADVAAN